MECIEYKLPLSGDLLLFMFKFYPKKQNEFIQFLLKQILNILNHHPVNKYDYYWLNQYILNNGIMFEIYNNQYIYEIINDQLSTMMNTFGDEMEQTLNNNDDDDGDWKNLCDYELKLDKQQQSSSRLSQDVSIFNSKILSNSILNVSSSASSSFDLKTFDDMNIKLNELLFIAHLIDPFFQRCVEQNILEDEIKSKMKPKLNSKIEYKLGPVKKLTRCYEKVETDYYDRSYPKCLSLLDLNRCSLTFDDYHDLMNTIHFIYNLMNEEGSYKTRVDMMDCTFIELLRFKNGFKEIQTMEHLSYCDIKLNISFQVQKMDDDGHDDEWIYNDPFIVELQLIYKPFLQLKKKVHKIYSIVRTIDHFNYTKDILEHEQDVHNISTLRYAIEENNMDSILLSPINYDETFHFMLNDKDQNTLLTYLCRREKNEMNLSIVELIINSRCDVNMINKPDKVLNVMFFFIYSFFFFQCYFFIYIYTLL